MRLGKELYESLHEPDSVELRCTPNAIIILPARPNHKAHEVKKGRMIYDNDLAQTVATISGADFQKNASTAIGSYHLQSYKDDVAAVVLF